MIIVAFLYIVWTCLSCPNLEDFLDQEEKIWSERCVMENYLKKVTEGKVDFKFEKHFFFRSTSFSL